MNIDINMNPAHQYEESHKQGRHNIEKLQCREDMLIQTLCHMYGSLQDTSPRRQIQETHGNPQEKSCTRAKRINYNQRQRRTYIRNSEDAIQRTHC